MTKTAEKPYPLGPSLRNSAVFKQFKRAKKAAKPR